ncbi:MAG: Trk system potassium transporter TrkA [Planctomycetota bacterium]
MKVTVLGAGEVGLQLARELLSDGHDVVLIDSDHDTVARARDRLDIEVVEGHGGNVDVLEQALVSEADLFCAVTSNDELNILASLVAKRLGAKQTAVRIRGLGHITRRRFFYRRTLDFDLTISPEEMTASAISRVIRGQDLTAVEGVAEGRIQLERYRPGGGGYDIVGKKIQDLRLPRHCLVTAVFRGSTIMIPSGQDEVLEGDELLVIGPTETIERIDKILGRRVEVPRRVIIVGGGRAGVAAATALERLKIKVTLLENDRARAEELSEELRSTKIEHADGSSLSDLQEENAGKADLFLAMTGSDEENLIACQIAKELGAKRVIALVKKRDYRELFDKLNVDAVISPRALIAEHIVRFVSTGANSRITPIERGRAEVIELDVGADSPICGKSLMEASFPRGSLVGAIVRREDVFIPRGKDVLEAGDIVIVFALTQARKAVEALV